MFGTRPRVFGTRPRDFGTRPHVFGTRPRVFGTRPRVFGTRPRVFFTKVDVYTALPAALGVLGGDFYRVLPPTQAQGTLSVDTNTGICWGQITDIGRGGVSLTWEGFLPQETEP